MKYRKKPVVIEARQWKEPTTKEEMAEWLRWLPRHVGLGKDTLSIKTLGGVMQAIPGDWIICGVKGEFYPCKPEIFDQTYELVELD